MIDRLLTAWARTVYRHPWTVVLVCFAIAAVGLYLTTKLSIRSNFAALLPENAQSVKDLQAISDRMGGMGTLILLVEGKDLKAMERLADDLAARLRAYPKDMVRFVDYKIDARKEFYERNKFLYVDTQELEAMRDGMKERISKEKLKKAGLYIEMDDDEEEKGKDKEFDFAKKRQEYRERMGKFDRFIDGYLTNEDGTALLVVIKTPGTATGVTFAKKIASRVEKEVAAVNPTSYHPTITVGMTGDLMTLVEEYYALRDDILVVSNLLVLAVILAVILYYRSLRMTIVLSLGLAAGLLTTFGLTYLAIGYLTTSTAFLASIVAGNGINPGIYFLARYREERKKRKPIPETLATTLTNVFRSIFVALAAASVSYASLMFVDFRGFNQFGFIGGAGMLICLTFAFVLIPALAVIMERHFPFKDVEKQEEEKGRIFSHGAATLVERFPRAILGAGVVAVAVSALLLAFFLRDPYEYNFRNLRNQQSEKSGSGMLSGKAEKIMGERSSPHVVLADNVGQVHRLEAALKPYLRDEKTNPDGVIKEVRTVFTTLPGTVEQQQEKIPILKDIRQTILKNKFDFLSQKDKDLLTELTPPENIKPLTMEDLPPELRRSYTEDNGTLGTPVYVYMADGMSVWRGKDLQRFAAVVKEIDLGQGEKVRSSGHAVIFSDMLYYIATDGPKSTVLSVVFVLLVIILTFRRFRHVVVLSTSMLAGVALMMGVVIVMGEKINFLNFIAIPIQFGIGVDYSVNIYGRFLEEGKGSIGRVLRSTGGAVMITSATTIIGYSALWFSMNGAINSFGTLANVGEFTCLFIAVLVMPAFLALFRGGLAKKETV